MKIFNKILLPFFVIIGMNLHATEEGPLPHMEPHKMNELFGTPFNSSSRTEMGKALGKIRTNGQGSLSIMPNGVGVLILTVPFFNPFSSMIQLYFTLFGLLQNDDTFEALVHALNNVSSFENVLVDTTSKPISSDDKQGSKKEHITKHLSSMNALKAAIGDKAHEDLKANKYSGIDKERVGLLEKYFYDVKLQFNTEVITPITKEHLVNLKNEMQQLESRAYSLLSTIRTTTHVGSKMAAVAGAGALAWGLYNHGTENVYERMINPALKFVQSFLPTATTLSNWGFHNVPSFLTFPTK